MNRNALRCAAVREIAWLKEELPCERKNKSCAGECEQKRKQKKEDSCRTSIERNRRCGMLYAKYLLIRKFNILTLSRLSKGCAHDERLRDLDLTMVQAPILAIYDKALECEPLVKADENYFQSWKTEIPRPKTTFRMGAG